LRPALVIASLSRGDLLVCQITSQPVEDSYDVTLRTSDYAQGTLRRDSTIRASRLFVIRGDSPVAVAGTLSETKLQEVVEAIVRLVRAA
jgi:mRNA interferase MazF